MIYSVMEEEVHHDAPVHRSQRHSFSVKLLRLGVAFALVPCTVDSSAVLAFSSCRFRDEPARRHPALGDGLDATPAQDANLMTSGKYGMVLNSRFVQTHASSTIPDNKGKMWVQLLVSSASYGDPYTVFFPPAKRRNFKRMSGNFDGCRL